MYKALKVFFSTTLICLICSSIIAKPIINTKQHPFTGFYASINAGISQNQFSNDSSSTMLLNNGRNNLFQHQGTMANNTGIVNFAVGASKVWQQHFYGGFEGFVNISNQTGSNTVGEHLDITPFIDRENATTRINFNHATYGFSFEPGLVFRHSILLYAIVGGQWANVSMQNFADQLYVINNLSTANTSQHQYLLGLQLGLGMKVLITSRLALNLIYKHTNYGNISTNSSQPVTDAPGGTFTSNAKVNLQTNDVLLGLTYYPWQSSPFNINTDADSDAFTSFYTGFRFGLLQPQFNLNHLTNLTASGTLVDTLAINSYAGDRNNPVGALLIGYMQQVACFNLAGELFINAASRSGSTRSGEQDNQNNQYITTLTTKLNTVEFGMDFKPGIRLSRFSLFYGRIGMAFNRAKLSTNTQFSNEDGEQINILQSNSKDVIGLRLGVGILAHITHHCNLTIDYIYTNYGHINNPVFSGSDGQFGLTSQSKASLKTQSVMLGLIFQP